MCTGGFISAKQTGHSSSFLDGDMTLMMKMTLGIVLLVRMTLGSDVDASKDLRSAGQSLASSFPLVGDFTLSMNSSACLKRSAASLYQIHVQKSYLGHRLFSSSTPVIIVFFLRKKELTGLREFFLLSESHGTPRAPESNELRTPSCLSPAG